MSPAAKVSPSANFQPAIPPSVMVGDMAGILKEDEAYRTTMERVHKVGKVSAELDSMDMHARLLGDEGETYMSGG